MARELSRQILDAREPVLGPEHPRTLSASSSLAFWTGRAGDEALARDQFAALLASPEASTRPRAPRALCTLAPTSPASPESQETPPVPGTRTRSCCQSGSEYSAQSTLTHWQPWATSLSGPERRETRPVPGTRSAALLPVRERVLGPEHPEHPRRPRRPRPLHRRGGRRGRSPGRSFAGLLPVRERVCGPEHLETLATRGDLAGWTGAAGDAAETLRDQFAALLPASRSEALAPEHRDALGYSRRPRPLHRRRQGTLPVPSQARGPWRRSTEIGKASQSLAVVSDGELRPQYGNTPCQMAVNEGHRQTGRRSQAASSAAARTVT